MKIIQGVRSISRVLPQPLQSSVLTIGNFDGVHVGHRALMQRLLERARAFSIPAIVMTFEPHPVTVLHPDRTLKRIFPFDDQREQLQELGVDILVVEPFSREFSQLTPERYIDGWIQTPFHPELLVVGHDFSFGANRTGTIAILERHAQALGFEVEVVPPVRLGEIVISSSRIRHALAEGDVVLAKTLLGRLFYLSGIVEKGVGRGRKIGVPTANLRTQAETIPAQGVYAAMAKTSLGRFPAAVNIGRNPTFQHQATGLDAPAVTIEAHMIGWPSGREIYGEEMCLEFHERLRDERKFSSVDELVQQIRRDIAATEAGLANGKAT